MDIKETIRDKWVMIIGIPAIAVGIPVICRNMSISELYFPIISSAFLTITIWLGIRTLVVFLWKKYPWELNPIKHLTIEISAILIYVTVLFFGYIRLVTYLNPGYTFSSGLAFNFVFTITITLLITSVHESWFFYMQWKNWQRRSQMLEEENIRSQYETLRTQISPHFLFNNLNTLANLIEENPKNAITHLQKTADFYRSILNLQNQDIITVKEELEVISNYIYLQKERFGNNFTVKINIEEHLMPTFIAPLTLQMLIENAVKHNIISTQKPLIITISNINNSYIEVKNNLQKRMSEYPTTKIGQKNIIKRYELLSQTGVKIIDDDNFYYTVLIPVLNL